MRRFLLALSLLGSGLLSAGAPLPLQTWWTDLGGDDAKKAYQAIWRFVEHPEAAVAFLEKNLQPAVAPDPKRVQQLLDDLESERFAIRDKAAKELEKLGELVAEALVDAAKKKLPLEAQRRVTVL